MTSPARPAGENSGLKRVALIGAGVISRVHAEVLRSMPGLRLAAVIDPATDHARALAKQFAIPEVFASVEAALAADAFDRAHVLVPPERHAEVTARLIAGGKPALVEKPLAHDGRTCAVLVRQAEAAGIPIGVNQNFVHHPAFARLLETVRSRRLGPASHASCIYNLPLRQIAARQFGHWMFASPGNLLLEQAVHPLSQIASLAGAIGELRVLPAPPVQIAPGQAIYPKMDIAFDCAEFSASLHFALGQAFPVWSISVVCDDGIAVCDMVANRFHTIGRTRQMEVIDNVASATRTARATIGASLRNASDYSLAQLRLRSRADGFYRSMAESIQGFHAAVDAGRSPVLDAAFGAMIVGVCERMRDQLPDGATSRVEVVAELPAEAAPRRPAPALAILGGTGFIGAHLVRHCVAEGVPVSVMARSTRGLPEVFAHPLVRLHRGDIRDPAAVEAAIAGAARVVNLAHGGGGGSREEIEASMVGGAETVALACRRAGVLRLVHVGSIAGLYLGPQPRAVTGATPPDRHPDRRADYARAKALCDRMLLEMYERDRLPVVILRPGVVVGEGGSAFHGGLGFFNNEQHCIGWNNGRNPLPFVLAEDAAGAILRACTAEGIDGHCYNIVGDVRPNAREYIAALGDALQRPLRFHPQSPLKLWASECGKWAIKRAGGRRAPLPSLRDMRSRGMRAVFDCADAKRDLAWAPVSDPVVFMRRAVDVHGG